MSAPTTSQRDCLRARIVLLRADGRSLQQAARQLGVSVPCVHKWSQRFDLHGLRGLVDKPGRGRKRSIPDRTVKRIIEMAGQAPPGRQRWSTNSAAAAVGVSSDTVSRIWREHGLKPHRTRTFKVSGDPQFEQKFWDVIGLYLDPPERSLVLCCDEKTQCQALERTQPCLPLGVGHIRTRTHDHIRHGTITLFAALSYLDGKLLYRTEKRHTHVEWLRFLKQIERESPKDVEHSPDCRQLRHAQARQGEGLAGPAQTIPHAFRADFKFLDELDRAILCGSDRGVRTSGQFHERGAAGGDDHGLPGRAQTPIPSPTGGRQTDRKYWRRSSGLVAHWINSEPSSNL